jgi:hypothetical protein
VWAVAAVLTAVLGSGCPAQNTKDDLDAAPPDAAVTLSIYAVSPAFGPLSGSTTVDISGKGFADGVAIYFGDNEAANVVVIDDSHLTCETPAAAAAGPVTVRAESGDLTAQLIGGFTYEESTVVPITWCIFQHPSAATATVQTPTELMFGRVYAQGVTDGVGQGEGVTAQVGYGPVGSNPGTDSGWTWTEAVYNADADDVNDEYAASLTVAEAGDYDVAFRFNGGAKWHFCDLDGSDNGYSPAQAGLLTVEEGAEPMVDWCQMQWPPQLEATIGEQSEPIYGRVFAEGLTEGPGAGADLVGEAGFGPPGTHPGTDPGWIWVPAGYNSGGPEENNDEYIAQFTPGSPGSYDYAFRFSRSDGPWTYCDLNGTDDGYSSSFAGDMTVSGEATGLVDWCTLQYPPATQTTVGVDTELIFGRVFVEGSTAGAGQGAGVIGQLGYGDVGSDPASDPSSWSWIDAAYNMSVDGLIAGDLANDEYMATLNVGQQGGYDYAFRFSKDGAASWVYCDLDGTDNGYTAAQAGALDVTAGGAPAIDAITLPRGTVLGGGSVTISGSGFGANPTVTFGASSAAVDGAAWDTITCTTPPHEAGLVDVTVENTPTETDTLAGGFEYIMAATLTADGDLSDWDPLLTLAEASAASDATPGYLSTLYVAFDADNLYLGIVGLADTDQTILVYLDVDYGNSTGVGNMEDLEDNNGALDDAISGVLTVDQGGFGVFGADFAAGTIGMAAVIDDVNEYAGWRGLTPVNDFPWLQGTVSVGTDAVEMSIPLTTLWPSGVDAAGQAVGVVVKLLKDTYGVEYSNQTLPEDTGTTAVNATAVFTVFPPGSY